jgi:hypothetical protein
MTDPTTLKQAQVKRYAQWGGYPKGTPYTADKCAYEMFASIPSRQCSRSNGQGPAGLYCKQHAKRITPIGPEVELWE